MALTAGQIERLRRLVNAPDVEAALLLLNQQYCDAVERDRAGLPPLPTGDLLRDRAITRHVERHRISEEQQ